MSSITTVLVAIVYDGILYCVIVRHCPCGLLLFPAVVRIQRGSQLFSTCSAHGLCSFATVAAAATDASCIDRGLGSLWLILFRLLKEPFEEVPAFQLAIKDTVESINPAHSKKYVLITVLDS